MLGHVLRTRAIQPRVLRYGLSSQLIRCYASFPPHTVIKMPALSPTMTAGNIGVWQKKVGDSIEPGDVLVEIETDKAQMDFEFQEEGVIAKLLREPGAKDVAVGNPIAILVDEGTDVGAFESFTEKDAGGEAAAAPEPPKEEKAPEPEPEPVSETPTQTSSHADDIVTSSARRIKTALEREPDITPAAKRLAMENGVLLDGLKGTGKGGKIVEADINKVISSKASAPSAASYEDTPISGMRNAIANRLQGSVRDNPHFYVTSRISVSKLLKLRQALNGSADGKYKISVNDFLIKAMAIASKKVPAVNSSWRDGVIRQFNTVDVSVAVATPTGLITPIVSGAESRGLESISSKVKELAKKARDGKLAPEEYQGGSICISNMGMNDAVDNFAAIINPPHAAILAVGAVKKVPIPTENADGTTGVEWDEQIAITGSFDHKVVDGVIGAEWVREMKRVLENPLSLML